MGWDYPRASVGRRVYTLARALGASVGRPPRPPEQPLVSVVIATYNWSSVLRHAIASVLTQTYPTWELIVVGDACTDDSAEVVASFEDPRIRWHNRSENHGGQAFPNNDGVALSRGEFVAYLGHDDIWMPDHLDRLLDTVIRTGADAAFALTEVIGPPGSGLRTLSGATPAGGYAGGHLPPSALMHRREMAGEIGGWRDYREIYDAPDIDFTQRALAAGNRFACTWALTAFKLPSGLRPGSYVEKRSDEQAELRRRISRERFFRQRELARIAGSRLRGGRDDFEQLDAGERRRRGKGAQVKEARRVRGLD